jgi:hypothetical protein
MEDFLGWLFTILLAVGFTAVCMDRKVTVEEFEKAVSKCQENGGLKLYEFDVGDATVTCNNGAVFYYKLGDKKQ